MLYSAEQTTFICNTAGKVIESCVKYMLCQHGQEEEQYRESYKNSEQVWRREKGNYTKTCFFTDEARFTLRRNESGQNNRCFCSQNHTTVHEVCLRGFEVTDWCARGACSHWASKFWRNDKLWLSDVELILIPFFRKLIQAEKCMATSGTTLPQSWIEIPNQWTRWSTEQTNENVKTVDFLIYRTESFKMGKNGFPGRCRRLVWKYFCDSCHAQWHEKVLPVLHFTI